MKINCTACGKKYDPLKKNGICPACGMHVTEDQMALCQQNDRVRGDSVSEVLRSYLNERLRKQQTRSRLRDKKIQFILCGLLALAMVCVGLWGYFRYKDRLEYYRSQRGSETVSTGRYSAGDTVALSGRDAGNSVSVRITGCKVREDLAAKVEGGFKIIEVGYEDSGSEYSLKLSDAYVRTGSGGTASVLDRFYLQRLLDMTEVEIRDSEYEQGIYSGGPEGGKHKMLFAVPADETEHVVYIYKVSDIYADDKAIEELCEFTLREGESS